MNWQRSIFVAYLLHPFLIIGSLVCHLETWTVCSRQLEITTQLRLAMLMLILWTLILILMKLDAYLLCWLWCFRIDYLLWCLIVNFELSRLTRWLNKTTHILWLPSGSIIAVVRIMFGRFCQYCLETVQINKRYNLF